jgi:hypothetical protein
MAIIDNENEVLHRVLVKLYPNYLHNVEGATGTVNETLIPGGMFSVSGHKLKVERNKPEVGVYFVSAADPSQRVKETGHLAENSAPKLIGVIPAVLTPGAWKLEIVTQYATGNAFLKEPRILTFAGELTAAAAGQPGEVRAARPGNPGRE